MPPKMGWRARGRNPRTFSGVMTQTFRPQIQVSKLSRPIVREAHDFGGNLVHLAYTPIPGEPFSYFKCSRCCRSLPFDQFRLMGYSDKVASVVGRRLSTAMILHPKCHTCHRQERGRWVKHPLYSPKLDRYWRRYMNGLRQGAKARGILVGVDKDDALGLFLECDGVCALTGLQTDWSERGHRGRNGRAYKAPSLDRIDSNGNYTLGNLQIVMQIVNIMKSDLPVDVFVALCSQIATHKGASFI